MMHGNEASAAVRQGNGPCGRRLKQGEDIPLTPTQSARLAELYEAHAESVVRFAYSRLRSDGRVMVGAWTLAEDIAQNVWLGMARSRASGYLDSEFEDIDAERGLLFYRVKNEVVGYLSISRNTERVIDWSDPVTCNTYCPLMPSGCALMELPGYLADMVAGLPEAERQALLLKLDGLHPSLMAEHLECSDATAARLVDAAVLLLKLDNPSLCGPAALPGDLDEWERMALAELSEVKREALLRLDADSRRILLLKAQGLTVHEIAKRLGVTWDKAAGAARCVSVLRPSTAKKPSAPRKTGVRRKDSKASRLAETLRYEVARMQPGERLPRRIELKARYGVSTSTVDDAWAILRRDGLIESNGVQGYRVTMDVSRLGVAA
ncbi:GntR family transcriptional regulator [Streptomyces sp. NPDC090026]|uniref:GntR family transcriptional regulator n=1 Tax=Streptomyces sp. NPDC090026 TaxID=3365923 RepID=UPI0037F63086